MSKGQQDIEGQMSLFEFIEQPKPPTPKWYGLPLREYLKYGPHTLIPEVRERVKKYLDEYGVPDVCTYDKLKVPCDNCTWYDGHTCCHGGHTYHYEYGFLICDAFRQSIVERKPSTVGDTDPHLLKKSTYIGPGDDYIREHPTCFYVTGHYLDREQGWHKVPEELPNFTTWNLIDVVLFGKKTGTPWMEHGKWEAKDWAFRSVDDRRNTESVTVLAWKLSEESENEEKEI